jgi:hypothetical protein
MRWIKMNYAHILVDPALAEQAKKISPKARVFRSMAEYRTALYTSTSLLL